MSVSRASDSMKVPAYSCLFLLIGTRPSLVGCSVIRGSTGDSLQYFNAVFDPRCHNIGLVVLSESV